MIRLDKILKEYDNNNDIYYWPLDLSLFNNDKKLRDDYFDLVGRYLRGTEDTPYYIDRRLSEYVEQHPDIIENIQEKVISKTIGENIQCYRGFNFKNTCKVLDDVRSVGVNGSVDIWTQNNFLLHHWTTDHKMALQYAYKMRYGFVVRKNIRYSRVICAAETITKILNHSDYNDKWREINQLTKEYKYLLGEREVIIMGRVNDCTVTELVIR